MNEFEDAEEGPSDWTDPKEEELFRPKFKPKEEEPLGPETDSEKDDLSSSFLAYGLSLFEQTEPMKPTTAYSSLIQSLLL